MEKKNNKWLLWVLLIFLPPFGIIYMWVTKKEFSSKKKTILTVVFGLWFLSLLGGSGVTNDTPASTPTSDNEKTQQSDDMVEKESAQSNDNNEEIEQNQESIVKDVPEDKDTSNKESESDNKKDAPKSKKAILKNETETAVPHRTDKGIIGVSDKDVSDISIYYYGNVKNDVTGNWRYSMTADDIDTENYALSYYKTYFENDSEIHGIVNFTRKTTSSIRVNGSILFLDIYDYVDGEEKDAKLMFSGNLLKSYMIYTDNGDIEQIQ